MLASLRLIVGHGNSLEPFTTQEQSSGGIGLDAGQAPDARGYRLRNPDPFRPHYSISSTVDIYWLYRALRAFYLK